MKRCEPPPAPPLEQTGCMLSLSAPHFSLTSNLMLLWVKGFIFVDHQQFHIEKITFLKTLPTWKFPLWYEARIPLPTADRGLKVKVKNGQLEEVSGPPQQLLVRHISKAEGRICWCLRDGSKWALPLGEVSSCSGGQKCCDGKFLTLQNLPCLYRRL